MCGISGYIAEDVSAVPESVAQNMHDAILYRGRDEQGEWTDGEHIRLFHTRLSIIDITSGQQPMQDVSGRYVVVHNGEIYNYQELRKEYQTQGGRFRTQSDTEVILEGFKLKGKEICQDLDGMFAFAIWDCYRKELFLARDHLGKKPLFWCAADGVFYFSSTLDAFYGIPSWNSQFSLAGITQYALLGSFPENATIYEQARKIPYGSFAFARPGDDDLRSERYWRMDFSQKSSKSLDDLLDQYGKILKDSIAIRLRSDVPIALTFSGGVDSGTIATICARELNSSLTCYTIDYHTSEDQSEETINAERAAKHLGLDWHYIHFDYHHQLLGDLTETYRYYDQPCQQLALVYSHHLYEAIKPYATVVLTGNGADELFAGYDGDERLRQHDLILWALAWMRPLLRNTDVSPYLRFPVPKAFATSQLSKSSAICNNPEIISVVAEALEKIVLEAAECGVQSKLDFAMFHSLTCSAGDSNYRLPDISGLASQVEVRSPFLDHRMVDFAARLPHKYKVKSLFSPRANKYLQKRYYERHMLSDIVWSTKKGMGWNLRWHLSIAHDPTFKKAFAQAFDTLDRVGINSSPFRHAWQSYMNDVLAGKSALSHATLMMNGFMLGIWHQIKGVFP
jgi:asparagine synthase (glutamine-hydrolysing)